MSTDIKEVVKEKYGQAGSFGFTLVASAPVGQIHGTVFPLIRARPYADHSA
jgi:hypothetical protein